MRDMRYVLRVDKDLFIVIVKNELKLGDIEYGSEGLDTSL
jgi:hypothetical protein